MSADDEEWTELFGVKESKRPRGQARRAAESRMVPGAMRREMRTGETKAIQINFRATETFRARLTRLAVAHKLSIASIIELAIDKLASEGG